MSHVVLWKNDCFPGKLCYHETRAGWIQSCNHMALYWNKFNIMRIVYNVFLLISVTFYCKRLKIWGLEKRLVNIVFLTKHFIKMKGGGRRLWSLTLFFFVLIGCDCKGDIKILNMTVQLSLLSFYDLLFVKWFR